MSDHTTRDSTIKLCACGCGELVPQAKFPSWQRKYISGHHPTAIRPLIDRFWEKVDKRGPDDCWEWQGAMERKGYGQIKTGVNRKQLRAHRVSWEIHYGPIPDNLNVLHRCDNPKCCNPTHLFLGTFQENLADMYQKGRHVHGDTHPHAKLTREQVDRIRSRYAAGGILQKDLAAEYGVTAKHISRLVTYGEWRHD